MAILAPQGLDYVAGFFAAVKAGTIAVPLFAPEFQGHAERLETALRDSRPTVVLTTSAARRAVRGVLEELHLAARPHVITIDDDSRFGGDAFVPVDLDVDDVSHLQYTSGSTRPPVGVEITHRAVGTNLLQMILSIDLLDRNTHGVSWLPLYHDMGLSMIGFPAVYGGHSTLMSPTAFIRRPQRWIQALAAGSRQGRVVTAAPNFAYEYTAQRGLPAPGEDLDLSNVVMIIGSEPVSMDAITTFNAAFAPYGLPPTAIKPSYGIAEATLFVSTIAPDRRADSRLPRPRATCRRPGGARRSRRPRRGRAGVMRSDSPQPVGRHRRPRHRTPNLPDGRVGEIWLHGNNIGRRYWGRPEESRRTFGATLHSRLETGSHADGSPVGATWLRTGDLGCTSTASCMSPAGVRTWCIIDGRHHYPQDIEATAAEASPMVRRGYVAAFSTRDDERGDHRRTRFRHPPRRSGTGRRSHPRGGVRRPRALRRRRPLRAGRRHPAHDERQAGPSRMPRRVPPRRDRLSRCYFHANTGCSSSSTGSWRPSRHSHRNCNSTAPVGAWMRSLPRRYLHDRTRALGDGDEPRRIVALQLVKAHAVNRHHLVGRRTKLEPSASPDHHRGYDVSGPCRVVVE